MHRARQKLLAALVRHADDGRVEVEHLDHGAREGIERLVEPQALREGARNLVERADLPRRRPLTRECSLALLAEAGGLLVELCVLDRHCELSCERRQQRGLVLAGCEQARRVGGEKTDDLAARHERNGERRADPALAGSCRGRCEPRVPRDVRHLENRSLP